MLRNTAYCEKSWQQAYAKKKTDVRGWYKRGSIVGIFFTDRVMTHLVSQTGPVVLLKIKVTYHIYPEGEVKDAVDHSDTRYHKHLVNKTAKFNLSAKIKNLVDEARNFLMY